MICKCFHVFPDVSHYLSQRRFPESTSRLFFRSLQNALDLSSFLTSSFFVFCCFIFSQKRKSMPKFGGCFATVFVTVYLCESICDCVFVWVYLCVCVCVREREREIVEQFRSVSASYSIKDEVIGTYDVPHCEFIWVPVRATFGLIWLGQKPVWRDWKRKRERERERGKWALCKQNWEIEFEQV